MIISLAGIKDDVMPLKAQPMDEERLQSLQGEFLDVLAESDDSVSIGYLVNQTEAEDRAEAKQILRKIIDNSQVTTTPNWEYKLASHVK